MRWRIIITFVIAILVFFSVAFVFRRLNNPPSVVMPPQETNKTLVPSPNQSTSALTENTSKDILMEPIAGFRDRVTKKPFGIFITPLTSPIQPERFRGYHTGADAEYGDVTTTVPVYAVQNGTIIYSGYVSGYGGVLVLTGNINNQAVRFLYGHLNPSQLLPVDTVVGAGQQIEVLGKGFSLETDYERRHLHFSIIKGTKIDFRGYVQNKNELAKWIDPLTLSYQALK
jgi:murein DD-endopeptidase MepM/ murein hydrolase activator NlpD